MPVSQNQWYSEHVETGIKTGFCRKLWKARGTVAPLWLLKFDWMKVLHKYRFIHTSFPHEKLSLQIYTDLQNGPESWEKLWNQRKLWKFQSLRNKKTI